MKKTRHADLSLKCFSPPVMLATFVVEIAMACYVVWRYKLNSIGRLVVVTLVSLAVFQLAEYNVCGGFGASADVWMRVGFVSITALPALGMHILHLVSGEAKRRLVWATYAVMVALQAYFLLATSSVNARVCAGNYVIFNLDRWFDPFYAAYYYGFLILALILGARFIRRTPRHTKHQRQAVRATRGLMLGYLVFLVPTTVLNSVDQTTISGIPSIMCGFAVIFAAILTFYVLPVAGRRLS